MYPSPDYSEGCLMNTGMNTITTFASNLSPNYTLVPAPMQTMQMQTGPVAQVVQQAPQPPQAPPKPIEHLFVQPPRPNRLLYTDTYIKYIERLKPEHKHVTNWERQLNATQENTLNCDANKLPAGWLKNGVGYHGTATNALWALRSYMLTDALNLSRLDQ